MELSWSHKPSSLPLLFISLAFLGYFSSFGEANDALIREVCSKSKSPSFCIEALKSDPRSKTANLTGLGQISIDLSTSKAMSTKTLVISLQKNVTDDRLKSIYDTCLENYGNAIYDLEDCNKFLRARDYVGVSIKAAAAQTESDTCDETFKEAKRSEPPKLAKASQNLQQLCQIVLIVANLLGGKI